MVQVGVGAWDVVSVNNVEDANKYLEVLIQKAVKA